MVSYVIDIEANGLLDNATKIWCIVLKEYSKTNELYTDKNWVFVHDAYLNYQKVTKQAIDAKIKDGDTLIGHNIIAYDLPLLEKLLGFKFKGQVIDTLVMSRVLDPDLRGGKFPHSLEEWMKRMGGSNQKVQNEDWSKWDPIMIERCKSDVLGTEALFNKLMESI